MSEWLIETSAWVAFFRGDAAAVARVDPLLAEGRAVVAGPVYAELLSGASSRDVQARLQAHLKGIPWLPEPAGLWERAAEARFTLARQGYQSSLVDVLIALFAFDAGSSLLTRDRDYKSISVVLPLNVAIF